MGIILRKSKSILGHAVFASRDFKKGEIVIKYSLIPLTDKQYRELSESEKRFTHRHRGKWKLYSSPERYVNHSTHPNTRQDLRKKCDSAVRNIKKGEEITTDSAKDDRGLEHCREKQSHGE